MSSARPFWSVMIPAYKPGAFLRQALGSVLAQDPGGDQMQIEVVDDCSPTGDAEALVREIAGDRVSIFRQAQNRGLCGNWNSCIERARGEWIHILHQDDFVLPGFYEKLRRDIEAFPEAGAAFCRHGFVDAEGGVEGRSSMHRATPGLVENCLETIYSRQRIQCASIVIRRTTYEKLGGYDSAFSHALDWEMWVRIAASFPILFEPEMLACFRGHHESMSTSQFKTGENLRDTAKMLKACRKYLPADKAAELSRRTLGIYAAEALDRAYALIWHQRDYQTALLQARAALDCERSFYTLRRAFIIWIRCMDQRLRQGTIGGVQS